MARRRVSTLALFLLMAATLFLAGDPTAAAAQQDENDETVELAERYAPVVMLKAQNGECDPSGEPYAPMSIDLVLNNRLVVLRQVGPQNPVLMDGPAAADLFELSESVFVDFPGSALNPGCVFEQDFRRFADGQPVVVYAHVATQDGEADKLALQYWFFWYYNDWNNKHEGDWEGIQLLFDVGTVAEALQTEPVSVGYAQHEGGELADWGDDKLERQGSRPVVYSSAGSHASYFGEALYLGRSGSEGFGCDNTDGPSVAHDPQVVVLPDMVDDPDDPLAWLAFEGRWGERQSGPFNGPTGPALKGRWNNPVDWHNDLRSTSVVVPKGDSGSNAIINTFCGLVEWGSRQLITLKQNPAALVISAIVLAGAISFALRRTDWSPVEPLPIVRRRRAGQLIRASFSLYRQQIARCLLIGLVYLPIAGVVGAFVYLFSQIPFVNSLLESEQEVGLIGVVVAAILGGLGHFLGLTVVTAAMALLLGDLEAGNSISVGDVYRRLGSRLGDLLRTFGRGLFIVASLLLSIVGMPWGLRQLVRYQLIGSVTVLEGLGGQAALDRSSTLIKGRWLHTAAVIVLLNALVSLVATMVGVLSLVLLAGLPLWLFSILIDASAALIVPYTAIAMVLLYGDAKAEAEGSERAERVEPVAV